MYSLADYDYELPAELIAQKPADRRDHSRLLRLERATGAISHHRFDAIEGFLCAGDVLVVNDTAVVKARLLGRKESGGKAVDCPGKLELILFLRTPFWVRFSN